MRWIFRWRFSRKCFLLILLIIVTKLYSGDFDLLVKEINKKIGIPEYIVFALIDAESAGDAMCVNKNPNGTFDYGLMQLNSKYIGEYSWRYNDSRPIDPFDPRDNLKVGMRYLKRLFEVTGSWYLAVCAYNAGLSRVRAGKIPILTKKYARAIVFRKP